MHVDLKSVMHSNRVHVLTYRIFELLTDGADDRQSLLELRGQLICVHVTQTEHVTHLQKGETQKHSI